MPASSARFAIACLIGLGLAAPSCLSAQERRGPEPERENIRLTAKIKGVQLGLMHVVTEKGDQYLVKVEAKPEDVSYNGSTGGEFLRPGMFVRFTGRFSKKGQPESAIEKLTVFSPRESTKLGIFADAGLAGGELFEDPKEKPKDDGKFQSFMVVGRISKNSRGKLTVQSSGAAVKIDVAKDAEVKLELSDLRAAQPGDSIYLEGWYYAQQKTHLFARRIEINAAQPLGKKPPAKVAEKGKGEKTEAGKEEGENKEGENKEQ